MHDIVINMQKNFFARSSAPVNSPIDPDEILADTIGGAGIWDATDRRIERPLRYLSLLALLTAMGGGIFYLGARTFYLQIAEGRSYYLQSQENQFMKRPISSPRGRIRDRFGRDLVENMQFFGVTLDAAALKRAGKDPDAALNDMLAIIGERIAPDRDVGFRARPDAPRGEMMDEIRVANLTPADYISLAPRLFAFEGVKVFEGYRRVYKDPHAMAHLLGFVGEASPVDIEGDTKLTGGDIVGKSGIELFYDGALRGKTGEKIIQVDSEGRETDFRLTVMPEEGAALYLTVDSAFQEAIYKFLVHHAPEKSGSVVAIDPQNGAVRALISFPGFNANELNSGIAPDRLLALEKNSLAPFFNRAIAGEFPSGSIIKPMMAAAALAEGIIDPRKKIMTDGRLEVPNPYNPAAPAVFLDWKNHGAVNLYDAIAVSSNVYFYRLGGGYQDQTGLGIDRIRHYAGLFGLGNILSLDLPGERPGNIPNPEWKRVNEPDNPEWRIGDTYNVSIGQGGLSVTPLQITAMVGAIANGGTLWRPHILEKAVAPDGRVHIANAPVALRSRIIDAASLSHIRHGMQEAVRRGTAQLLSTFALPIAAKTGTAQTGRKTWDGKDFLYSWTAAFAPYENPSIALVVVVEDVREGQVATLPVVNGALEWYFRKK